MLDTLKDRLRNWLELEQPEPLTDIYIRVQAEDIAQGLAPRVQAAITATLDEAATTLAETYLYENEEGQELLERMKSILSRYPAVDQGDIEKKVADAIVSVFMKTG